MVEQGRVAPRLRLCRGCSQFVRPDHADCPFCGGDLDVLEADHEERQAELRRAVDALSRAMADRGADKP